MGERVAYGRGVRGGAAVVDAGAPDGVPAPTPVPGFTPLPFLAPADAVEALRARLAGRAARDHAVLGFLADELREARAALTSVAAYVAEVEAALGDAVPSRERMLGLALGGGPMAGIDRLGALLGNVRRRLAQVAARM